MGQKAASNLDVLINDLSADLKPVKRLAHPLLRVIPWMALAVAYVSAVVAYMGVRPDMAVKLADSGFLFETILMSFIALSAAAVSSWLCVPDMRGSKWMMAMPLTALGVFMLWTFVRSMTEGLNMPAIHWDHCFADGALMGFVPMATLMLMSRAGATTYPLVMSLMNVLAVGALGYTGLRITCVVDTVGHACFYHLFPFMVLGLAVGTLARKIYRW